MKVVSSNAFREAFVALAPLFERAGGGKVEVQFIGGAELLKRLRAGEPADLAILQASSIDELINLGKLVAGSRTDLARSGIGAAVRAGAPKPDLRTGGSLQRALRAAKSIAVSSGPSGVYLLGLFERLGIAKEKITQTAPGVAAAGLVAKGEVEIGFQQLSEILPVAGVDYAGALPPEVQHYTVFSGGLHAEAKDPEAAKALMRFLASPEASRTVTEKGMEQIR